MNSLLDRLPGWPTEKQLVMLTTYALGFAMLGMAWMHPALWSVELFKTLITVVIVTGCVNMVLAYYFTANKSDEARSVMDQTKAENTAKAFEAIRAISSTKENTDGN